MTVIRFIVAMLIMSGLMAVDTYPILKQLPIVELNRRAQQVYGPWNTIAILGDNPGSDRYAVLGEMEVVLRQETMTFDQLGPIATQALNSLRYEILGVKRQAQVPAPTDEHDEKPTKPVIALKDIMENLPFCLSVGIPDDGDATVRRFTWALMYGGESEMDSNLPGIFATAIAERSNNCMESLRPELIRRVGDLTTALANGYRRPAVPAIRSPFDNAMASWCLWRRPVGEGDLFVKAAALYDVNLQEARANKLVEVSWQRMCASYQTIYGSQGRIVAKWSEVIGIMVMPRLLDELSKNLTELMNPLEHGGLSSQSERFFIPMGSAMSGSDYLARYGTWLRTGGPYFADVPTMEKFAGVSKLARARAVAAVWLIDRLIEELLIAEPDDASHPGAVARTPIADLAKPLSGLLQPLRGLGSGIPGYGPTVIDIANIQLQLKIYKDNILSIQGAIRSELASWHKRITTEPSLAGWKTTARQTAQFCQQAAELAQALAYEHQQLSERDFLRMQRDAAGMLTLYNQRYASFGPPLLYGYIRSIRIGAIALASDASAGVSYIDRVIPGNDTRILQLPLRLPFEPDDAYWERVCISTIYPSFMRNAIEEALDDLGAVWIRSRAGSTRVASATMDRLMTASWVIRRLIQQEVEAR